MFIIVGIFTAVICLALSWYYWNFIAPYSGIPCAMSLFIPVLRNFLMQKIPKHTPVTHFYFQLFVERFRDFYSEGMCLMWLLKPYLFIFGEESIKVFTNESSALNKSAEYAVMADIFGEGLGICNSEKWHKRRKLLDPAFRVGMLKLRTKGFNKHAAIFIKTLMREKHRSENLWKHTQLCFFSINTEFILGLKADNPKWKADLERLIEFAEKYSEMITYRMLHPWLHSKYTLKLFSKGREFLKTVNEGSEIIMKILQDRKKSLSLDANGRMKSTERDIYSSSLMSFVEIVLDHHLKESSYTEKDLFYEITTFIFSGYDTVSYGLMWCLFLLGHHPETQEIVRGEIDGLEENEITYHNLTKLKYLECVILESLRLYPILPLFSRQLERNVQCGKYSVPRGTTVVFFPFLYHRNPEIYPNPEKFDPERFLHGNARKQPWTYITFSEGMRNCIGKKLAIVELKIVLAHVMRNFKVTSLDRREDIQLSWEIILKSVKPLRILLTPRKEISVCDF